MHPFKYSPHHEGCCQCGADEFAPAHQAWEAKVEEQQWFNDHVPPGSHYDYDPEEWRR
jgi:hypothetical protein